MALAPEGRLVRKGDLLILFDAGAVRGGDPPQPGAALAGGGRPREGPRGPQAAGHPEPRGAAGRAAARGEERPRAEGRAGGQGARQGGRGRADGGATPSASCRRRSRSYDDLKPLLAEGFITRMELERAEQQVARAKEDLAARAAAARRAAQLRPPARAQPGALRRPGQPRDAAPARERRLLPHGPEAGGDRLGPEPHPGGLGQARARQAAARALRGAGRGARASSSTRTSSSARSRGSPRSATRSGPTSR